MIIFFYGEDRFRSGEKLASIKNRFVQKDEPGLSIFDFEEKQEFEIASVVGAGGLFSLKKLIIIKNLLTAGIAEKHRDFLNFLEPRSDIREDEDIVIVFWEKGIPRKNNALFKWLLLNSKNQKFEKLTGEKLFDWAEQKIKNTGGCISGEALDRLIAYSGEDLFRLENEILKLVNFKEAEKISEKDVDLLVGSKAENNIFEAIEALGKGNGKRAARLLHEQIGKGEDPFYIFSMYVYQFRNLLKIGDLHWRGMGNEYEIAKRAGLHPFVVKKGLAQLRGYSMKELKKIYRKLSDLDIEVKTGKIDIIMALDKIVTG